MADDFTPHAENMFGYAERGAQASTLGERFLLPPFSVLNAREGWWQDRKRAWLALGIQSELGRGEQLIPNGGGNSSKARYTATPGGSPMPILPTGQPNE